MKSYLETQIAQLRGPETGWTGLFRLYVFPFIDEFTFQPLCEKYNLHNNPAQVIVSLLIFTAVEGCGFHEVIRSILEREEVAKALPQVNPAALTSMEPDKMYAFYNEVKQNSEAMEVFKEVLDRFLFTCRLILLKNRKHTAGESLFKDSNSIIKWLDDIYHFHLLKKNLPVFLKDIEKNNPSAGEKTRELLIILQNGKTGRQYIREVVNTLYKLPFNKSNITKPAYLFHLLKIKKLLYYFKKSGYFKTRVVIKSKSKPKKKNEPVKRSIPGLFKAQLSIFIIFLALVAHIYIVRSIIIQPLNVNKQAVKERSVIWNYHNDTIHRTGPGADFFAVYHAGVAVSRNNSPYKGTENPKVTPYFFAFRYLPVAAETLGRGLTKLKPLEAYRTWVIVLEIILAVLLTGVFTSSSKWWVRTTASVSLLLCSPFFLELHMGQFTFATMSLLAIALLVNKKWRSRIKQGAGIFAGTLFFTGALLLKAIPAASVPGMIRHKRFFIPLLISAAALFIMNTPYFAAHTADWTFFSKINLSQPAGGMDTGNYGFLYLLKIAATRFKITAVTGDWKEFVSRFRLILLAVTALTVFFAKSKGAEVGVATLMIAHFISYTHVWEHHMSGVVVMGILLFISVAEEENCFTRNIYLLFILAAILSLILPTPFALFDKAKNPAVWNPGQKWPFQVHLLIILPKALPAVILFLIGFLKITSRGFTIPWAEKIKNKK